MSGRPKTTMFFLSLGLEYSPETQHNTTLEKTAFEVNGVDMSNSFRVRLRDTQVPTCRI